MRKNIFMLLLVCSVPISANANDNDKCPEHVMSFLDKIIENSQTEIVSYSVMTNPVTDELELKKKIVHFSYKHGLNNMIAHELYPVFCIDIANAFTADEEKSYQLLHLGKGEKEYFSLEIISPDNSNPSTTLPVRTSRDQEMWLMSTKNPDNPMMRDTYAIVWSMEGFVNEDNLNKFIVEGDVFFVTSLIPEIYNNRQSARQSAQTDLKSYSIIIDENGRIGNGRIGNGRIGNGRIDGSSPVVGTEIVEKKDSIDRFGVWFSNLSSSDQSAFTKKFEAIANDIHLLESMYSAFRKEFDQIAVTSSFPAKWDIGDKKGFDKIAKRIEILGKDFGGALDFAKSHDAPNEIYSGLFSTTLNTFRLQLAIFENWYELSGYLPDSAKECQRTLIDVYEGLQHRVKEALLP